MIQSLPRTLAAAAIAGALLIACAAHAAPRLENAWLTQAEAAARAARVSNVAYNVAVDLTGTERFGATSTIGFDLKDSAETLTIDLNKAAITALTVNGKTVTPRYNDWFLTIAAGDLTAGRNTVVVTYTRAYNTNGEGLHRMLDPADGKAYLFSQLAPANAHQVFALFDQPDMKASYALSVLAPADWQVISAARESRIDNDGANRRWTFPATKKMSAYAFSLHAGPYKVWEDGSARYPMRLFARQSVAAQVPVAHWFKYTKRGLAYFDRYFGIPYQFGKYDQLLVPDLLYGAMENTAAVTFGERSYLHKAALSDAQREGMARVILHEMAHQWFGDLVTMEWWNGLWLSESFASFMATLALDETTEFKHGWQSFFIGDKQRGYLLDQGPASHPVDAAIASSANAYDNLDAITYIKGASALKQLRHLLGDEVFRKGVRNYLVKHKFANARLDDFIGELGRAAGRDLGPWTQQWLYQAGVNTIDADYACKQGKVSSFALRQGSARADQPTLREQRVRVATFVLRGAALAPARDVAVTYKGARTPVPALVGSACPDLVYPNHQDWGFVKVRLDRRSFATAGKHMAAVRDPLLRTMLWQSLWDGVRDARYPLDEYLRGALDNVAREADYPLQGELLSKIADSVALLQTMRAPPDYLRNVRAAAWNGMQASSDTNFKRRWFNLYQNTAIDKEGLEQLAAILSGATVIDDLPLNDDLRWGLIATLNRYDHPGGAALIAAELARDTSASGQAAALRATVLRPDPAIKAEWLAKIEDVKTTVPFARIRIAMESLYPAGQGALAEASAEQRLRRLPEIDKAATPAYLRAYAATMIPATCTPASVARLESAIVAMKDLSPVTGRALRTRHEEDRRCVAIKEAMTPR